MMDNNDLILQLKKQYNDVEEAKKLRIDIDTDIYNSNNKVQKIIDSYISERKNIIGTKIGTKMFTLPKAPVALKALYKGIETVYDDSSLEQYQEQKNEFIKQCIAFDKLMLEDANDYIREVSELNLKSNSEKDITLKSLLTNLTEKEKKLEEINARIESNKLVNEKYFNLLPRIIEILEDGRAEKLSEALNLAIVEERDIEYKEEQLSIERQKLAEAERQTVLAEKQERREKEKEERLREMRRW